MIATFNDPIIGSYVMNEQGIIDPSLPTRQQMDEVLRKLWNIPAHLVQTSLEEYFSRSMPGATLRRRNKTGVLYTEGDLRYNIIFVTPPELCYNSKDVILSFRAAMSKYRLQRFVLVRSFENQEP